MVWQKKRVGRKPVTKTWTTEEMKAVGWCLSNNISISCMPNWKKRGINWLIDIKIYEYYKYYYDKHRK